MPFQLGKEAQIARIQRHLAVKGKLLAGVAHPRVFLAYRQVNWEENGLVRPWQEIADVMAWDFQGINDSFDSDWHRGPKAAFNRELLTRVQKAHAEKPIDLFFGYLSGRQVTAETIRAIGDMGIITINIGLDDTTKFWGFDEPGGLSGIAPIAPAFDMCITTQSSTDVAKYVSVGANPLFLPPGGNPNAFALGKPVRDIPVSFIGQAYGARPRIINELRAAGIAVQTFGKGWPNGPLSHAAMQDVYSRTLINLGFGYIGEGTEQVGLKGRDFEVPLTGGLYVTTHTADLAQSFVLGEEIESYQAIPDLVDKLKFYAANPARALAIGAAGRSRCLADHTWAKRFQMLLAICGGAAQESQV